MSAETLPRRAFLGTLAAGGAALVVPAVPVAAAPVSGGGAPRRAAAADRAERTEQRLHPDAQTDLPGVETFFLGNGRLTVALQHATGDATARGLTPLGLMLWDPHHFARKWSTYTFHPEWGLARGQVSVAVAGQPVRLDPARLTVMRGRDGDAATVVATWEAGAVRVVETFRVPYDAPALVRDVRVEGAGEQSVTVSTTLYYSHALFTDYRTDHAAGELRAEGYARMRLTSDPAPTLADRYLTAPAVRTADGAHHVRLTYDIGSDAATLAGDPADRATRAHIETAEPGIGDLLRTAQTGLRAAVALDGRFDASIWQYNMEWVIDACGVAMGATRAGQFTLARSVLHNVLTRLVDEKGITAHASRFRDTLDTELNQNGAALGAAWTYWAWTGDTDFLREHWDVLRRVGELPLGSRYLHPSGLVRAGLDFYERDATAGVEVGFDVGHQALVAWGLQRGADLAREVGDAATAARWAAAGTRMADVMLRDPDYALVDEGRLIARRLPDGRRQRALAPRGASDLIPEGSELATAATPLLDPTTASLYPILLGLLPVSDPVAQATLDDMETLWNDASGGFLRYHRSSDPDAPGGWTFPTALVGQALARAGRAEGVRRVLDWLQTVQGARGGAYFEIYADAPRPVPPLPPLGIIVWGWGEIASLLVDGLLGVEPEPARRSVAFRPHLPAGVDDLRAAVTVRGERFDLHLQRGRRPGARYGGAPLRVQSGRVALPDGARGGAIDITLA